MEKLDLFKCRYMLDGFFKNILKFNSPKRMEIFQDYGIYLSVYTEKANENLLYIGFSVDKYDKEINENNNVFYKYNNSLNNKMNELKGFYIYFNLNEQEKTITLEFPEIFDQFEGLYEKEKEELYYINIHGVLSHIIDIIDATIISVSIETKINESFSKFITYKDINDIDINEQYIKNENIYNIKININYI